MTNNTYLEQVKADVKEWMENESYYDFEYMILTGEIDDLDHLGEWLSDTLWAEDAVTGNASGSYTFNREEAKKHVLADMDTVREALYEFGTEAQEIGERFLNEDWEYLDVTARCYVLNTAIWEVIEEQRETIEELIAKREADEA